MLAVLKMGCSRRAELTLTQRSDAKASTNLLHTSHAPVDGLLKRTSEILARSVAAATTVSVINTRREYRPLGYQPMGRLKVKSADCRHARRRTEYTIAKRL
jgi:hypothetical protein